jgi:hypothetical protein
MTHDQLVKVFPDGRTVHVPTDGVPLKGYELAKADIEKRGNGDDAATIAKPNFLAALFKGKSNDEDDEGATAPAAEARPAPITSAKAADAKPADAVPTPRAKPQIVAALQLASADADVVPPLKAKPAAETAQSKPETPADIINARGFWDDGADAPKQATPEQLVAAVSARRTREAADPQPTASVPAAYQAMAYVPGPSSPVDRASPVMASAPIPRSVRPAVSRNAAAATGINTIATKGSQGQDELVANSTRLSAAKGDELWMRIMMLAPSAVTMSVTVIGDSDLTLMRAFFVKPPASVTMSFSDDPMPGLSTDRFSGSAATKLDVTSFTMRTALLR